MLLTKDKADAADFLRACVRESAHQLRSARSVPQENRLCLTRQSTVKFEVKGDGQLARSFLESLTDVFLEQATVLSAKGWLRVSLPATPRPAPKKAERSVQVMTSAAVDDDVFRMLTNLERDYVKWMHGACLDMQNQYSPAMEHTGWSRVRT